MFTRFLAVVSLVFLAPAAGSLRAGAPATVPNDERAVVHALNRLTFGPRPGDVERVKAMGLSPWIEQQLAPARIDNRGLDARLAHLDTLELDSKTIATEYAGPAMRERRQRQLSGTGNREPMTDAQRKARAVIADIEQAKLLRAVYSERQLEEVLVDFWFNHFNVFAGKGATRNYVGEYEREAIRPFVFGHFRDLLEATAKSPAMLFYLDNWESSVPGTGNREPGTGSREPGTGRRGPGRPGATGATPTRAARPKGINENYARELMELHTLGVDGGYTQQDIVNVARAFTGWTIRPRQGSGFLFVAQMHDNGEKTVLGHVIKAGGVNDGMQVLDILAAHPSTAHFIASKLATRFVSDNPPAALVDRAAARFTATRGDLREVVRTIITSPEFFAPEAYRAKVKTPLEFVASAVRTTGAEVRNALPLARELREQGMPLYFCQPPTGYDDTATTWVSSGALVSRMNFAVQLGDNALPGVRVPNPDKTLAVMIGSPEFQHR
jgi:uncharacterized protein (DUF1800 family)